MARKKNLGCGYEALTRNVSIAEQLAVNCGNFHVGIFQILSPM